ncbi:MerR family transcriptional regulator [Clostridium ihumii]|uniref:MerR family transcriptional regulator n=1 Tax=Clostridium ihumii TaxID=1470356 RepID=UPI000556EC4C|nr:methyltransferase domain-containing protein [Clostridium ihumii]
MEEKEFYTTGEFAKMAGVTIRTIRYYDTIGILKPSMRNEKGHRLYTNKDFIELKRILALKYLGLSLDEVIATEEKNFDKDDMERSLKLQKNIIKNKMNQMKIILNAIETAEVSMKENNNLEFYNTIDIIKMLEGEKELLQRSIDSSNLYADIKLQDKFGSNTEGWYTWVFDHMDFKENDKVLEIGCGNGELWLKNINKLENNANITLTDICEDMIRDAKENLKSEKYNFKFEVAEPSRLPYENESFDIVIADHILFYMRDLDSVLKEIKRVLKKGGYFYCSTMGNKNMNELEDLILGFSKNIRISRDKISNKFGLENGEKILGKYFKDINLNLYEDKLIINNYIDILEYIYSIPGTILEIVDTRKKEFENYVYEKIKKDKGINITINSGVFKSIRY